MKALGSIVVAFSAAILVQCAAPAPGAASDDGPMAVTRRVLEKSHDIVVGPGDRKQKLVALNELLRSFLDTEALSRQAMGTHLDGRTPAEVGEFLRLFRELFVRTYVQRLLLFESPDFAYGAETISGRDATVGTEIVTPRDRFAVDYRMRKSPAGWRATDILVEDVSIARNFRAQFDAALAKDSFQGVLGRLRKKLDGRVEGEF